MSYSDMAFLVPFMIFLSQAALKSQCSSFNCTYYDQ